MINRFAMTAALAVALTTLSACSERAVLPDEAVQGPSPQLATPVKNLIPTVEIAPAKGWPAGAAPRPAPGLAVNAFAKELDHPRWLYVLPNGDVLVAETNAPPRPDDGEGIKGWVMKLMMGRAGAETPSANRITLLRDTSGAGTADTRTVFLQGLNSPFGMTLVGNDLYVACTDAILRFTYTAGATQITRAGREDRRLARGHAQSSLDQERDRERRRIAALRHRRLQQQRRGERHGERGEPCRHPRGRHRRAALARLRLRIAQSRTVSRGSRRPARCGPSSTSATSSAATSSPTI